MAKRRSQVPAQIAARDGFCACGCGERAAIAPRTRAARGEFTGYPLLYVQGHHMRGRSLERAHRWKGGRHQNGEGYWLLFMPGHHLANGSGYVLEHRLVWEQTSGQRLRRGQHVHHIDGDRGNNAPANLVAILNGDHMRIHRASGDTRRANLRRYRDPEERKRHSERMKRWWAERKAKA